MSVVIVLLVIFCALLHCYFVKGRRELRNLKESVQETSNIALKEAVGLSRATLGGKFTEQMT